MNESSFLVGPVSLKYVHTYYIPIQMKEQRSDTYIKLFHMSSLSGLSSQNTTLDLSGCNLCACFPCPCSQSLNLCPCGGTTDRRREIFFCRSFVHVDLNSSFFCSTINSCNDPFVAALVCKVLHPSKQLGAGPVRPSIHSCRAAIWRKTVENNAIKK